MQVRGKELQTEETALNGAWTGRENRCNIFGLRGCSSPLESARIPEEVSP
jgi:hypothetical protein